MRLSPKQYAQALHEAIVQTNPKDHGNIMEKFVKVLHQNGDLGKYDEIEAEYKKLELSESGIREVDVTFARDIEMNKSIVGELNKIIQGKVEYKTNMDDGLIGGVVVKVDDTLIDASVKGQLDKLNQSLKE
jgi:F-type H+-transporting ATPase subunit delta